MTQPAEVSPAYWNERLSLLVGTLTTELHAGEPGTWVSRQLCSGFTFSLTVTADATRRARISTEDRPAKGNLAAWDRFKADIESMRQHLGISRWEPCGAEPGPGAARGFAEPTVTQ